MSVGESLKTLRKKAGYTIKEVSLMSGEVIDRTTISKIENDERTPSLKALYMLSQVYKVDMRELTLMSLGKIKIKKT
jgi:transcriptional regulator with XRE-family HTH domain